MKPNVADCQFCGNFSVTKKGLNENVNVYRCLIGGVKKMGRVIYMMDECPGREIDWEKEICWTQIEALGVIEWVPDKSEFFLTEGVQKALEAAEETLDREGMPLQDLSHRELTKLCVLATFVHLEEATAEGATFVADFLVKFHKSSLKTARLADRVIRPGIKWPKNA